MVSHKQHAQQGPRPHRLQGVWCTKCQIHLPMKISLHSLILVVSMSSFCSAAGIHQLTMCPEPLFSLAPRTKHASCGPRLVANMPAPHGHQVVISFGGLPDALALSRCSMFLQAWKACSSPGYEIFGMGGISNLGGSPMQPRLQSPTANTHPEPQTSPPAVGFFTT